MNSLSRRDVLAAAASTALCGPRALRAAAGNEAAHLPVPLPRHADYFSFALPSITRLSLWRAL